MQLLSAVLLKILLATSRKEEAAATIMQLRC